MIANATPVTVLHLFGSDAGTDLREYLSGLLPGMAQQGLQQRCISLDGRVGELVAAGLDLRHGRAGSPFGHDAAAGPGLARRLRDDPCDVIHAWGPGAADALAVAQGAGPIPPVCLSIHEPAHARLTARTLGMLRDGMPAVLACPSPELKRTLVEAGADPRRCALVRPGVVPPARRPGRRGLTLAALSSAADGGGHVNAIWATALLRELYGWARIVLRTDGVRSPGEARFADSLPDRRIVEFAGAGAEFGGLLADADFAIFSASHAICPTPVAWAMSAGVPVIATPRADVRSWIRHEETGLLVDPPSPRLLAQAVVRLREDPSLRAELVDNARRQATRLFQPAAAAARLAGLYRAIRQDLPLPTE